MQTRNQSKKMHQESLTVVSGNLQTVEPPSLFEFKKPPLLRSDSLLKISIEPPPQFELQKPPLLRSDSLLKISIDFDDASKHWNANKKKMPNGCYKYVCGAELANGLYCKKTSSNTSSFCYIHKSICKKVGII